MAEIKIPYSRAGMVIEVPDENLSAVLCSAEVAGGSPALKEQQQYVEQALDEPIGSKTLEALVDGKEKIVIITSDHTRPVPSKITMPILLNRIRRGNATAEITILIATGYHRPTTEEELLDKFGAEVVDNESLVVHNAFDDSSLVNCGTLPSGGELWLNKLAVEADLLIAEGFIEPHFFAGFSGGRKSVLPGVAGAQTVLANHCSEFINSCKARTGNLTGNPIHVDMLYAAQQANLAFILNVALDHDKCIIKAFAGDCEKAHLTGCEYVTNLSQIKQHKSDIVISSNGGYPLDQNIYQAVKGMTAAEANCADGGVIIMIAGCEDGHGGESFYKSMAQAGSPEEVLQDVLKIDRNKTRPDQWEYQILARILSKYTVIMVTDLCDPVMIKEMHMEHAPTFEEALARAFEIRGRDAKVAVIPDGVSVIVTN